MNKFEDAQSQEEKNIGLVTASKRSADLEKEEGILTVDVYQTDNEIVIRSTIAGVSGEDLDIAVTGEMVTIKGTRKVSENIKSGDYFYRELYWGSFSRSIILPEEVDPDGAKAVLKNGLLVLRLPKLNRNRAKKIKINA